MPRPANAPIIAPKKLIEAALPLDEINKASAKEKSIRHGHPSTLHLWWARRPLAAARAVLFAQLVNDPSWKYTEAELGKPQVKSAITRKRNELFRLITRLVQWENINKEEVLSQAREIIRDSWRETCEANKGHPDPEIRRLFDPGKPPNFHDPFAGGGSIPLEAQRLGLQAYASDLNPVAVLINKAMIEIPPRFAGRPPVGPIPKGERKTKANATEDWSGARGLAEDVRRYGAWIRDEAEKRIGHLYPKARITKEMAKCRPDLVPLIGQELTVIAWLWARTVRSPNPAFSDVEVPLVSSFVLATKPGKEAYIVPVIDKRKYDFTIKTGAPPEGADSGTKLGRGANFRCLLSGSPISPEYIRAEAMAGRMGSRIMAVVAEGQNGRVYLAPRDADTKTAAEAQPTWAPKLPMPDNPRWFSPPDYGLPFYADLFTPRQLIALTTFSELIHEAAARCAQDGIAAGSQDDDEGLDAGGSGAKAYGEAVSVYLAFGVDRSADYWSAIASWHSGVKMEAIRNTFGRHAIPMTWDFAEGNPFSNSTGNWMNGIAGPIRILELLGRGNAGFAAQAAAQSQAISQGKIISTDPPYYDNIGYADLSDYFYVWLRKSLARVFPSLFATLATPKAEELVATPYRHGGRKEAELFFLNGMTEAIHNLAASAHPAFPVTIYYAFKQSETNSDSGTSSTGWDTFLQAVLDAGFGITGTWPIRTELANRMIGSGTNALASSIAIVCRPRSIEASSLSRRDFVRLLQRAIPQALADMTADPFAAVAPVDLAQAAIGPGMAIFSKYASVLEADGAKMSVHNALIHINKAIDDYFTDTEGELDADTRFCIGWFQQYGFETGAFGEADVLARAKGTSVDGARDAGVLSSAKGKVRLLRVKEYPPNCDPTKDDRKPIWEACHRMCRALGESETAAGALLARMPNKQDAIRQLAYRLYTLCERKGWAGEARAYNELVTSWPAIVEESHKIGHKGTQPNLL